MIYSKAKKHEITSLLMEIRHIPIKEGMINMPIDALDLSVRAANVLARAEIKTISDFISWGPEKLSKVSTAGEKTIYEIETAIKKVLITGKSGDRKEISLEHKNGECLKTENSNLTFEEQIKTSFDEKFLNMPVEELKLSTRSINALARTNLKTIKDIVDFGLYALHKRKNVGRKTIDDIKNAVLVIRTQTHSSEAIAFIDAIEGILSSISPKFLPAIKAKYGYDDGKCKTLEEIGNKLGVTRERVRQIIKKEIRQIKYSSKKKALQSLIEPVEELLLKYQGIISINDFAHHEYFVSATRNQLKFLMNLFEELYETRYRIIDRQFLTSLNDDEVKTFQYKIREAALKCRFPTDEKDFTKNITLYVGDMSNDYLIYHLIHNEHAEISNGKVLSPGKLSIPQRVKLLMRHIDKPMHFTEIAKLYGDHFKDAKIRASDLDNSIHARIGDSKDFIIVNQGTFMLRDKFKVPHNIDEIIKVAKEILQCVKSISDTRYLINELKKQNIDIGNLSAYSLKTILLEYPGFVSYRKFEVGLDEFLNKHERKPLSNLIMEILSMATKPMHVKTIWKEMSKQRGFPEYAISKRMADDPRFIRIAPATYTVSRHIVKYEEKRKIIISFAKEWIQLKRNAISSFFVCEVLKETKGINDLPLGLVEHILATSPEFIKLPNGFYNLATVERREK